MQSHHKQRKADRWWHLGATGLLQPLSEDFLYRSPQQADPGSWCRRARQTAQGGAGDA